MTTTNPLAGFEVPDTVEILEASGWTRTNRVQTAHATLQGPLRPEPDASDHDVVTIAEPYEDTLKVELEPADGTVVETYYLGLPHKRAAERAASIILAATEPADPAEYDTELAAERSCPQGWCNRTHTPDHPHMQGNPRNPARGKLPF